MSSGALPSGRSSTATAPRCSHARFKPRTTGGSSSCGACAVLRGGTGAPARPARSRSTSGRDRGVAPRHRETCGAGAHPVQTRPADAGRAEEDADARADRRRDRQRGAVPLPGRPARFAVITSAGTARAIRPDCAANRSRSVREYSLSSIASTRSPPSGRTGPPFRQTAAIRHDPGRGRQGIRSGHRRRIHQAGAGAHSTDERWLPAADSSLAVILRAIDLPTGGGEAIWCRCVCRDRIGKPRNLRAV